MKKLNFHIVFTISLLLVSPLPGTAQVRVARIFSDNMVMQRDSEVTVWGWAEKGERITIQFDGNVYKSRPDRSGRWEVTLSAHSAGGPYSLEVYGKKNNILINNILFGDVWVCSGQSNMEWVVMNTNNSDLEIRRGTDLQIRHFKIPHSSAEKPEDELAGGTWELTTPESVGQFTAVGYYFARELRKEVDVPIGLLNTSWGGSRIEPWMSAEALGMDDAENILEEIFRKVKEESSARLEKYQEIFGELSAEDKGMTGNEVLWSGSDLDETGWQTVVLPGLWENLGFEGLDGVGWFRKTINLPPVEAMKSLELGLGKIDDSDVVWVNGEKIGGMEQAWDKPRVYTVDASVLKPGKNIITVRVEDTGGGGGIYGEPQAMYIKTATDKRTLAGEWKFRIGSFVASPPSNHNQLPTLLYNKMINPLLDFPVKGVIWYQGESNAGSLEDATKYRELFPQMIADWRNRWNSGDFPFLFVQLANFMAADDEPKDSFWAVLRESQSQTLNVPNTGQAVIIDIGEADDIHPRNKQDVGLRLALAARHIAYGEDLVFSGPVYKSHEVSGDKVVIEFNHTGSGLMAKDKYGYLKGFAIAGSDLKFVWAQAKIEGDHVVVWSDEIKEPEAVRYAWGNNPDDANLYNIEGLPASPFRTDK